MNDGEQTRPSEQHPGGLDWLGAFLQAHAEVNFNALWITFALGQAGALAAAAPASPQARKNADQALDEIENHARDFMQAAAKLDGVMHDMVANARRNLWESA